MTLASQPMWWAVTAYAFASAGTPPSRPGAARRRRRAGCGRDRHRAVLPGDRHGAQRPQRAGGGRSDAGGGNPVRHPDRRVWLGEAWPRGITLWGAILVGAGIVAFSVVAARAAAGDKHAMQELRSDRGA
jgi:hypothetical protein